MFVTRNGETIEGREQYREYLPESIMKWKTEDVNDPYGVWNGNHFELTLRKVCMICYDSDDMIPPELEPMADDYITQLDMDLLCSSEGVRMLFDARHDSEENVEHINAIVKEKVIFVTPRVLKDADGVVYPTIYDENPRESWITLIRYLKSMFPMPTAGITGSAGKSTTTMLTHWALSEKFNVFNSVADGANMNDVKAIGRRWILQGGDRFDFFLQESGMGECRLRDTIRMTEPDVFVVLNIDKRQHIEEVESEEEIINDKLSYDEVGKEDGIMIINIDDPIIAAHEYRHKTVTFGVENEAADCIGKNIEVTNTSVEFDVEYEGHVTHLKANIPGRINVYNMMAAYLVAKQFGVTDEQVQNGLLNYKSRGVRQKIDRVGGRILYLDCFNYPMDGIMASLETLEELEIPKKGRRFAVLTEKDSFDDVAYQDYFNYGVMMGKYKKIDKFVLLAQPEDGKGPVDDAIYQGLLSVYPKEKVVKLPSHEEIAVYLQKETKRGDAILFKGRGNKYMYRIPDMAYGTSYSYMALPDPPYSYYESEDFIIGRYTWMIGGISVVGKRLWNQSDIIMPDKINGHEVVRIADRTFAEDSAIKSMLFGKHLRSIGKRAFIGCKGIEKIHLPEAVKLVDIGAFERCEKLMYANMMGVEHIGPGAFRGCKNLRKVVLSSRCGFISQSAFNDCPNLTIFAPKGSYAKGYAKKYAIRFIEIEEDKEKAKFTEHGIPKKADYSYKFDAPEKDDSKLTVLACGNVLRNANQLVYKYSEKTGKYSYGVSFKNISAAMGAADLTICNVESTLGAKAYEIDLDKVLAERFEGKKRDKKFKALKEFKAPEALASIIGKAGFDVAVCANNHANDCGHDGIVETKGLLEKNGVAVSGIKSNPDEKGYCIVEKKGIKIAVLSYAYAWYSQDAEPTMEGKAIEKDTEALLNIFTSRTLTDDLERIKKTVDSAKEEGADIVIAYYHWGTRNKKHANMLQRYIAHKTAEMGVDAIIGTHPNVLEEKEIINVNGKDVPVYYSIGEILNGKLVHPAKELATSGCMAKLEFDIDSSTKTVKGVKAGFAPTGILAEQLEDGWEYTTVDLANLNARWLKKFAYSSPVTSKEVKGQVKENLEYESDVELCIDDLIAVSTEHRNDIRNNEVISKATGGSEIVRYVAENANVGSILPEGIVVATNPGVAAFMVYTEDGKKYQFMLEATGMPHRQSFTRTLEYKYTKLN